MGEKAGNLGFYTDLAGVCKVCVIEHLSRFFVFQQTCPRGRSMRAASFQTAHLVRGGKK